ncbi:MAG: N-acetylated-alpha-linked acidic dipeptidase [Thermomicrobiales bacterium]|nr:N-acetylated-alpha-linked acidic dipeptidase [Thermomicrobiales bacterium]
MGLPTAEERRIEEELRGAVSAERLQEHLEVFSKQFRDSGSEDERTAARYIVETVARYGLDAEILELDSLISWPLEGKLAVLDADGHEVEQIPVRTRSFGAQTPAGGIEADLVFVPFAAPKQGEMIFSHRAVAGDYTGLDVVGKIVLTADGGPDGIRRAQERGAAGHVHIWPSDENVIHEMIGTSVWGTPTPESARRLPTIPVLGVKNADGNRLAGQLASGPVRVRMESNVRTEWMRLPLATASIPGTDGSGDFLLVGSHIDSWYEGITDNATGDAALIEMARVLVTHGGSLRRGVRFCWWPGHSTGRYSGSTWYADTHFRELRDHAVGYLNIDSPGVRESTIWDCRYNTGEIEAITAAVVEELSGQTPNIRRPLRAGDQSFLGVGLSSLGAFRMLPLDHPDRKAVGGCAGAYWWHSPEDTLDKADAAILADDTQIYATLTARMCLPEVIPFDFTPVAQDFLDHLTPLQEAAGRHLDLGETIAAAGRFKAAACRLAEAPGPEVRALNDGLKRLARIVNSALYTIDGPYEMDPALQLPVLPGLAPMRELARLDPASSEFQFLLTKLRRQRNRIEDALLTAAELAEGLAARS